MFETGGSPVLSRPGDDLLGFLKWLFSKTVEEQTIGLQNCHMLVEEMLIYWAIISSFLASTTPRQKFRKVIEKILCFLDILL